MLVPVVNLYPVSFMYSRNRSGPSTVPCGTPDRTVAGYDLLPSSSTDCFLFWSQFSIQFTVKESITLCLSL